MGLDPVLTEDQTHALLDLLSHYEVYQEIRDFRSPRSLDHYGPPFTHDASRPSNFPSLQSLVAKFLLTLPGLRDVSPEFWTEQCAGIVNDLEAAELSESYDKGLIGIRKTLATAVSALIEYPARAVFTGFEEPHAGDGERQYNVSDPEDLQNAFMDLMQQSIYGNILDELVQRAAETDRLADHSSLVQAAHEYILVNLASFMHYTLILSPKGQQLLSLIDRANKLIPYTVVKQTLKIGNVASMLNAMMKVVLAKMSVTSVTNWMGLTNNSDEGQNLMQYIISTTLQWDIRDFKSRASKIEKDKEGPEKQQLEVLRGYLQKSREEHQSLREKSRKENKSIVYVILSDSSASTELTPHQHRLAQDYLTIQLSIRDREQIIKVLCKSNPDNLTQGVRALVKAYEPIIRSVHNAVDLSETVSDFERFLTDMIKLAKIPSDTSRGRKGPHPPPTVGDFVQLLKKHVSSCHKFLHQCAKNGKEVTSWFHDYARDAATQFRRPPTEPSLPSSAPNASFENASDTSESGAGALTAPLTALFATLDPSVRETLIPILNDRSSYLNALHHASASRLHAVIASPRSNHPALSDSRIQTPSSSRNSSPKPPPSRSESPRPGILSRSTTGLMPSVVTSAAAGAAAAAEVDPGPGAYLARWQDLLDATPITPAEATEGKVRSGGKGSVLRSSRTDAEPEGDGGVTGQQQQEKDEHEQEAAFEAARTKVEALDLDRMKGGSREGKKAVAPDAVQVTEALGKVYRELLAERSCSW